MTVHTVDLAFDLSHGLHTISGPQWVREIVTGLGTYYGFPCCYGVSAYGVSPAALDEMRDRAVGVVFRLGLTREDS